MVKFTPNYLSKKISEQIIYYNPDFRSRQDSIRYGLEWMLAAINQILLVFIIACYFDCVIQAMVILSAGGFLRMFSGGSHFKGYYSCLFFSTFQIMVITYISIEFAFHFSRGMKWMLIGLIVLSFFIFLKKSPKLHKKMQVFSPQQRTEIKYRSICVFLGLMLVSLLVDSQLQYGIWIAMIMQSITLTDSWHKIILSFDKRFNKK